MEIHFLGTGAGVPSTGRNVSSIAIRFLQQNGSVWMIDCGEATQHQILRSPLKLSKLEKIFITHLHGDHIFGLPGLLGSRSFQGSTRPLTIYGPKGIKAFIDAALTVSGTYIAYPLSIVEVSEGGTLFTDEQVSVECVKLSHGIDNFGYRIQETDQPGALDTERLMSLGIQPGPVYRRLKNGESIRLENGQMINGKDFIGETKRGRVIAVTGDTKPCEAVVSLAENADVLVHEATFAKEEARHASEFNHSTTVDAARAAKEANAHTLILTHISSRYQEDAWNLINEAKQLFSNSYLAEDLWVYCLRAKHKNEMNEPN
ncbi:ribonuclease Z [Desertibacillus haloalkaliphilus]|uniref:ribonuclease Z n=1 Tax=Desertibacillus haloalkaliphilus TaxID=1328930 RepID=UPI001C262B10|nr:ribonuclease Z [Desertibacillus haloalkaliphilus]MBU8907306.1 ribonuclease Z [Desertibacillus haloalkaliphilus]